MDVIEILPVGNLHARPRAPLVELLLERREVVAPQLIAPEDPVIEARHGACLRDLLELVDLAREWFAWDVLAHARSHGKLDLAIPGEIEEGLGYVLARLRFQVLQEEARVQRQPRNGTRHGPE